MTAVKSISCKEIGERVGGDCPRKTGRENGKKAGGGPGNDKNWQEALRIFKKLQILII